MGSWLKENAGPLLETAGGTISEVAVPGNPVGIGMITTGVSGIATNTINDSNKTPDTQIQQLPQGTLNSNTPSFKCGGRIKASGGNISTQYDNNMNQYAPVQNANYTQPNTQGQSGSIDPQTALQILNSGKMNGQPLTPQQRQYLQMVIQQSQQVQAYGGNLNFTASGLSNKEILEFSKGGWVNKDSVHNLYPDGGEMKNGGYLAEGGQVSSTPNPSMQDMGNNVYSGGTHEQNPNGGVPVGNGALVEQGEYIFTNPSDRNDRYVFSNRFGRFNKKSFADEAKSLDKKYKNWENDPIVAKDLAGKMSELKDKQEKFKDLLGLNKPVQNIPTPEPNQMNDMQPQTVPNQMSADTGQQSIKPVSPENVQSGQYQTVAYGGRIKYDMGGLEDASITDISSHIATPLGLPLLKNPETISNNSSVLSQDYI